MNRHFARVMMGVVLVLIVAALWPLPSRAQDINPQTARAGAVADCMDKGKTDSAQTACVNGLVVMEFAAVLREMTARVPLGGAQQAAPAQVIVKGPENGRTAWDVFASMVTGIFQFGKETIQTVGPVAAQVYATKVNGDVQKVVAGYNRDRDLATVQGFTTMGGQVRDAGIHGYEFVQAPGAVSIGGNGVIGAGQYTGPVLSGTGVVGSGAYTGPVLSGQGTQGPGNGTYTPAPVIVPPATP